MPRKTFSDEPSITFNRSLADKLKSALTSSEESGQPLIYEHELATGRFRVLVIWDEWNDIPLEQRSSTILKAYELAKVSTSVASIMLASGLTLPEATTAGMLPYQVSPAIRSDDPVTLEQCRDAMLAEGASTLFGPDVFQLRFATRDEAEACRSRLISKLPTSAMVWLISVEVSAHNYLGFQGVASAKHS